MNGVDGAIVETEVIGLRLNPSLSVGESIFPEVEKFSGELGYKARRAFWCGDWIEHPTQKRPERREVSDTLTHAN